MFDSEYRKQTLESLPETQYDLAIVGGGITGAGVARDAASRGMKVIVLEAKDFASGTSSRSSKLVHGGIRYLENFEFPLVHEALTERKILLQTAPHLVQPLDFLMPIYKTSRVGRFKMAMGMLLYDILSLFESPHLHRQLSAKSIETLEPHLETNGLRGGFIYSDAFMDDDRLVIEVLRSAHSMGADAVNYIKVDGIEESGNHCEIVCKDELKGNSLRFTADRVISCVGPWTDFFGAKVLKNWQPKLRPTKGVHLIFSREKLPVKQAVVMAVEKRIIFVIPRGEMVIVGTTDTDYPQDPSEVNTEPSDVFYLLSALRDYFPTLKLEINDISSCYSGVRPLVYDGSQTTGKTSREHEIFVYSDKILCVAGGKYTTYRSMANEIVDKALGTFTFERRMTWGPANTKTAINPLVTPERYERAHLNIKNYAKKYKVPERLVALSVARHGEEAENILMNVPTSPYRDPEESYWCAEAMFSIRHEMCLSLVDFYWRRSPLFLFKRDHGRYYLKAIANIFAQTLGWSHSYKEMQINAVEVSIQRDTKALAGAAR